MVLKNKNTIRNTKRTVCEIVNFGQQNWLNPKKKKKKKILETQHNGATFS